MITLPMQPPEATPIGSSCFSLAVRTAGWCISRILSRMTFTRSATPFCWPEMGITSRTDLLEAFDDGRRCSGRCSGSGRRGGLLHPSASEGSGSECSGRQEASEASVCWRFRRRWRWGRRLPAVSSRAAWRASEASEEASSEAPELDRTRGTLWAAATRRAVATREALANALCHRDYAMGGSSIGVAVYDDRLEVTSTGPLHYSGRKGRLPG